MTCRWLEEAPGWHEWPPGLLTELIAQPGRAVMLLDGLDEVFDVTLRAQVMDDLQRFNNQFSQLPILVTSRVVGYQAQRLRDAEFRHFMLQDLDAKQFTDFLQSWHEVTFDDPEQAAPKRDRLQKAIRNSKPIGLLAGNPLLLTMMAILNRNQELPRDRAELYAQASRVLLHQWDTERALVDFPDTSAAIGLREKTDLLCRIAAHMQAAPAGRRSERTVWTRSGQGSDRPAANRPSWRPRAAHRPAPAAPAAGASPMGGCEVGRNTVQERSAHCCTAPVGRATARAAGVAAEAHESEKLERLCRYIVRPAISEQRAASSDLAAGQGALSAEDAVAEWHDACGMGSGGVDGAHPCAPPCGRPAVVQIGSPADLSSPSWRRWCRPARPSDPLPRCVRPECRRARTARRDAHSRIRVWLGPDGVVERRNRTRCGNDPAALRSGCCRQPAGNRRKQRCGTPISRSSSRRNVNDALGTGEPILDLPLAAR